MSRSIATEKESSQEPIRGRFSPELEGRLALWCVLWLLVGTQMLSAFQARPLIINGLVFSLAACLYVVFRERQLLVVTAKLLLLALLISGLQILKWQRALDCSTASKPKWERVVVASERLQIKEGAKVLLPKDNEMHWFTFNASNYPWSYDSAGSCLIRYKINSIQVRNDSLFSYIARQQRRGSCGKASPVSCLERFEAEHDASLLSDDSLNSDGYSLLRASVLGDRNLLNRSLEKSFQRLGISHLLVVSGYHVGVIFGAAYFLFFFLFSRVLKFANYLNAPSAAAGAALMLVVCYACIVGFALPVLRATLVLAIFVIFRIRHRSVDRVAAYLLSMLCAEMLWPGMLFEPGGQLTFLALAGLLLAQKLIAYFFVTRKLLTALIYSFFAWMMTASACLVWFRETTILAPLFNLLIGAAYSVMVICLGPFALMLMKLGVDTALYLEILDYFADGIEWLSRHYVAELAFVKWQVGKAAYWLPIGLLFLTSFSLLFTRESSSSSRYLATKRPAKMKGRLKARKAFPPKMTRL